MTVYTVIAVTCHSHSRVSQSQLSLQTGGGWSHTLYITTKPVQKFVIPEGCRTERGPNPEPKSCYFYFLKQHWRGQRHQPTAVMCGDGGGGGAEPQFGVFGPPEWPDTQSGQVVHWFGGRQFGRVSGLPMSMAASAAVRKRQKRWPNSM